MFVANGMRYGWTYSNFIPIRNDTSMPIIVVYQFNVAEDDSLVVDEIVKPNQMNEKEVFSCFWRTSKCIDFYEYFNVQKNEARLVIKFPNTQRKDTVLYVRKAELDSVGWDEDNLNWKSINIK